MTTHSPLRRAMTGLPALALALAGCAAGGAGSPAGSATPLAVAVTAAPIDAPGTPASAPPALRVDPRTDGNGHMPPGLATLRAELERGMAELKAKANPPPYYIGYE